MEEEEEFTKRVLRAGKAVFGQSESMETRHVVRISEWRSRELSPHSLHPFRLTPSDTPPPPSPSNTHT